MFISQKEKTNSRRYTFIKMFQNQKVKSDSKASICFPPKFSCKILKLPTFVILCMKYREEQTNIEIGSYEYMNLLYLLHLHLPMFCYEGRSKNYSIYIQKIKLNILYRFFLTLKNLMRTE